MKLGLQGINNSCLDFQSLTEIIFIDMLSAMKCQDTIFTSHLNSLSYSIWLSCNNDSPLIAHAVDIQSHKLIRRASVIFYNKIFSFVMKTKIPCVCN